MSGRWRAALAVAAGVVAVAAGVVLWASPERTSAQQVSRFMGGNPSVEELGDLRTMRLRFPAGSRSNWHTHTDGQLLMIEEGRGLTQVRGQPVYEMHPGEPWWTPAGVEHWHGAAADEASLQLTIYAGSVNWLEPVTDEQYRQPARRP
ncbi:MAG TPA: cupin domain-containing protein [Longimicrobiales bacterium]|nr:cupin domain-containing protein [Longimicrobiales bacterium]